LIQLFLWKSIFYSDLHRIFNVIIQILLLYQINIESFYSFIKFISYQCLFYRHHALFQNWLHLTHLFFIISIENI
jgi:hypothetical protein